MKVIIAGSRSITNYDYVLQAIEESGFVITEVVSGAAQGVDTLGERFSKDFNLPCKKFRADWSKYGKSAGMVRNNVMASYADSAIVIWDGSSKGSANMISIMKKRNKKCYVFEVKNEASKV